MTERLQKAADNYTSQGHLDPKGFQQHIAFHRFQPPASLASFVNHFWTMSWDRPNEVPFVSQQVLHRPYVDIYVSEADSGVQYTFRNKRDYKAVDKNRIIGARLLPGAFHALWQWSVADLHDKNLPLQQVFPEADAAFVKNLLSLDDEQAILALADLILTKKPQPDRNIVLVNEIIEAVETDSSRTVKDVARQFGKSERWLQQLFQEYVGIGIKWLIQRNRLLEAAKTIRETENPDWVSMAYELEYSSQQHFITDFKRVLGKTPLQYKKEISTR